MTGQDQKTEEIIMKAARKVFLNKGYDGTTMQEIADEAGINKSLLHYYYRSKDKLFRGIFLETFRMFIPRFSEIFMSEKSIFEKIEEFAIYYIDVMIENPLMPSFVLREISTNPESLVEALKDMGAKPEFMIEVIRNEIDKGNIIDIDPRQLLVNLIGLCIFPFAARPLLGKILFNDDDKEYDKFLEERKREVPQFINQSIRKK